jgi:hypothetical protein
MSCLSGFDWQTFADQKLNQIFIPAGCLNAETHQCATSGFKKPKSKQARSD